MFIDLTFGAKVAIFFIRKSIWVLFNENSDKTVNFFIKKLELINFTLHLQGKKRFFFNKLYLFTPLNQSFMNKAELISAIADNSGLSKVDSKKALDGFIAAVSSTLKAGGKVALVGFGSFDVYERSSRTGVNPATGKKITIAAKKVVKFKAGAELADLVK